ncbi:unnamed protein product [Ixodes pacificus]
MKRLDFSTLAAAGRPGTRSIRHTLPLNIESNQHPLALCKLQNKVASAGRGVETKQNINNKNTDAIFHRLCVRRANLYITPLRPQLFCRSVCAPRSVFLSSVKAELNE